MFRRVWVNILSLVYRILIIRVQVLNKAEVKDYDQLKTFGEVQVQSNLGPFTFVFKEDRRNMSKNENGLFLQVSSYFAEMRCPDTISDQDNIFHQKVILVVKLRFAKLNYEALGKTLLDIYLKAFAQH